MNDKELDCIKPDEDARDAYGFGENSMYFATETEIRTRIRWLINQSGLTDYAYAKAIELAPDKLSKVLRGKRRVSSLELALIATFSKVTVGWILAMVEEPVEVLATPEPEPNADVETIIDRALRNDSMLTQMLAEELELGGDASTLLFVFCDWLRGESFDVPASRQVTRGELAEVMRYDPNSISTSWRGVAERILSRFRVSRRDGEDKNND